MPAPSMRPNGVVDEAPTLTLLAPKPNSGTAETSRSPAKIGSCLVYDAFSSTDARSVPSLSPM